MRKDKNENDEIQSVSLGLATQNSECFRQKDKGRAKKKRGLGQKGGRLRGIGFGQKMESKEKLD